MSWEGSNHVCGMGEYMWYHRGLRTRHELKGATQEPGRAKYFLVEKKKVTGDPVRRQNPGDEEEALPLYRVHLIRGDTNVKEGQSKVSGR